MLILKNDLMVIKNFKIGASGSERMGLMGIENLKIQYASYQIDQKAQLRFKFSNF
jgi:hypothetical protein